MLSVIDLKAIQYERTYPYTRARNGRLVQEPYFTVSDGGDLFHMRGRLVMWSFLDSLYTKNPLPRGPVEDDLFAPQVDTPSMLSLFTDFAREVSVHNRYLVLEHDEHNTVGFVRNLDQYTLSTDIERVGGMIESNGLEVEYKPSVYIDSKGSHLRASLHSRIGRHMLRVIDIGSSYYMSVTGTDHGLKRYGLIPPTICPKNNTKQGITDVLQTTMVGLTERQEQQLPAIVAVNESPYLLTRELDRLFYERMTRCI